MDEININLLFCNFDHVFYERNDFKMFKWHVDLVKLFWMNVYKLIVCQTLQSWRYVEHKCKLSHHKEVFVRSCYHSNRKVEIRRPAHQLGGDTPTLIKTKPSPTKSNPDKRTTGLRRRALNLTASGHLWRRIRERTGAHASPSGSIWKLHTGPVHCPLEIKEKREPEPWFSSQPERRVLHDVIPVDSAVRKPSGLTCQGTR